MKSVVFSVLFLLSLGAEAQMTSYFGMDTVGAERGLQILAKIPDSSCSWKKRPEKGLRPEKLSPEVLNFVGSRTGPKVKLICQGTVVCEGSGVKYQSDNFMTCGMRGTDCSPKACWTQFLNDKISFLNNGAPTGHSSPAADAVEGAGRD